jgi:ABC-type nickel/cobalt efflux system permease component RcnA
MMLVLVGVFYATMVAGGYAVEIIFGALGLVPDHGRAQMGDQAITWNYTTWLNVAALVLTLALLARFFRTGGREMLAMMGGAPDDMAGHDHSGHHAGHDHAGQDHAGRDHAEHGHAGHGHAGQKQAGREQAG